MRPFRGFVWGCALAVLAAGSGTAQAAWNNVFQVCCHSCRSSANYAPAYTAAAAPAAGCPTPCPQPCPQQTCTTRYVQRCYYQPVTSYRAQSYYEPVTTYRTSYYYEPVCSYRYSCYYDPCTCSYQQVAQPVTSYRLRSQCSPVTSYLQRTCMQPVTSYRQISYYEPVTTCCTTTSGPPVYAPPAAPAAPAPSVAPAVPAAPVVPAVPAAPPSVGEQQAPAPGAVPTPPNVTDSSGVAPTTNESRRYTEPPPAPRMPPATDSRLFRPQTPPASPAPARSGFRPDRVASRQGHTLEGRVVQGGRLPQPGARVLFINADQSGSRRAATADGSGRFRVQLASGNWLVYVQDGQGNSSFQKKVAVGITPPAPVLLVSR